MTKNEIQIKSVSEYLSLLNTLRNEYPCNGWWDNPSDDTFLYRGVSKAEYKLLPKIFRNTDIVIKMLDQEITFSNKTYLTDGKEFNILRHFATEAAAFRQDIREDDYLQWAEIAQHYGVPTRFLDWTTNPLVALYFTCLNNRLEDGAVWILHKNNYTRWLDNKDKRNPDDKCTRGCLAEQLIKTEGKDADLPQYPDLIIPRYVDPRMAAQGSYFMYWGTKAEPLEDMIDANRYMSVPESPVAATVLSDEQYEHFILKVIVKRGCKQVIYRELDMLGMNAKVLFPGLDGIGQYIDRKYTYDYNEHIF